MKLSKYAKQHNIKYKVAWNRFHTGKIPNACLDELGRIVIKEQKEKLKN